VGLTRLDRNPTDEERLMCVPTSGTRIVVSLMLLSVASLAAPPADGTAAARWRASDVLALAERFGQFHDELPAASLLGMRRLLAFEEHTLFVYAAGELPACGSAGGVRKVLFLKPDSFLVVDQFHGTRPGCWRLEVGAKPVIDGQAAAVAAGEGRIRCRLLAPAGGKFRLAGGGPGGGRVLEVTGGSRIAVLLQLGGGPAAQCAVTGQGPGLQLAITLGSRRWRLNLAADTAASTIAMVDGQRQLLPERLLPAGIMPHGLDGVALIERWDRAYRGGRKPPWDSDVPEGELVKVVESGVVRPCRALELGCGSGTDALYLASKGFEVTAIDLAPTALNLARAKAARAGVEVRWLLADVLRPPARLEPFDFLYDSGCYHGVRRIDAAGYVETVKELSRPGALMLLIAGNANEPRHYGPPRVDEPELVADFARSWDFVWLRELRRPGGPWFWSVLLRRRPTQR